VGSLIFVALSSGFRAFWKLFQQNRHLTKTVQSCIKSTMMERFSSDKQTKHHFGAAI